MGKNGILQTASYIFRVHSESLSCLQCTYTAHFSIRYLPTTMLKNACSFFVMVEETFSFATNASPVMDPVTCFRADSISSTGQFYDMFTGQIYVN